jgi:large subunit ribosomal protein L29
MKAKQVKEMSDGELSEKLIGLKKELFNLRFSHATGQLANPNTLSACKHDIARVKTVIREREIKAAGAAR